MFCMTITEKTNRRTQENSPVMLLEVNLRVFTFFLPKKTQLFSYSSFQNVLSCLPTKLQKFAECYYACKPGQ